MEIGDGEHRSALSFLGEGGKGRYIIPTVYVGIYSTDFRLAKRVKKVTLRSISLILNKSPLSCGPGLKEGVSDVFSPQL